MYTTINYLTKIAMRKAIVAGGNAGTVYQPNNVISNAPPTDGVVTIEGPHYPKPHSWYARVLLKDGLIVKVVA